LLSLSLLKFLVNGVVLPKYAPVPYDPYLVDLLGIKGSSKALIANPPLP
jgi:hypothetical protein